MISKVDLGSFGNYVRVIADMMGLRDWKFRIEISEDDDAMMSDRIDGKTWGAINESEPGMKLCTLTFRSDIREWDGKTLRDTVCHELIHCHTAPLTDQVRQDLAKHMGSEAYELFQSSFTRNLEYAVDGMAVEWASRLPYMRWK